MVTTISFGRPAFIFTLLVCGSTASSLLADEAGLVEKLYNGWNRRGNDIHTAELEMEFFRCSRRAHRDITRDEARNLIEQMRTAVESGAPSESIRELTREFVLPKRFANTWVSARIIQQGSENIRNHLKADLVPEAFPDEIDTAYDGSVDVNYVRESRQVSLFESRSNWLKYDIDLLRGLPIQGLEPDGPIENGILHLRGGEEAQMRVMSDTGAFLEIYRSNGRTASERFFGAYAEYDGGDDTTVLFPSFSADVRYIDGLATTILVFIVREAKFNNELPEDAFHVPVPKGTKAALYTGPRQVNNKGIMFLDEPLADARDAFVLVNEWLERRRAIKPAARSVVRQSNTSLIVIGINIAGILLLLVGYRLFRKKPAE